MIFTLEAPSIFTSMWLTLVLTTEIVSALCLNHKDISRYWFW